MKSLLSFLRGLLVTLSIVFLMCASFLGGYWYHDQWYHDQELQAQTFPILEEAHRLLLTRGLNPPPPDPALEYGMIKGMLQAYGDRYTGFFEPPVHELQTNQLEGKFGGIGVEMRKDEQGNWVLFPFPDSPAQEAGVQEGDRLLAVDDLEVTGDTNADAIQAAVRGTEGTRVTITVGRAPDFQPLEIDIKRQEIAVPSVTWRLDTSQPLAGIIRVNLIAATTSDEIQSAVKDLQKRGATHFVLDLRDNPGGYLTAGIDIAHLFLKEGVVMQQQYRDREVESFAVEHPGPLVDLPLVALINKGSASASEIIAGALQATGRAPLIGLPSYGKDTIQLVFELSDKSSLHLTAARWWTPGLKLPLAGNGLQPDILVDPPTDDAGIDLILQAALKYLFEK